MRTKPTIAGLQREVETLKETVAQKDATIKALKDNDLHVRMKLSELLDATYSEKPYTIKQRFNAYSYPGEKKEKQPQDWLGIAFLIGELRADANYSCVIEARESFRRESQYKSETINRLVKVLQENGLTFDFNERNDNER